MTKQELQPQADQLMAEKKIDKCWITSDGQAFIAKTPAENYRSGRSNEIQLFEYSTKKELVAEMPSNRDEAIEALKNIDPENGDYKLMKIIIDLLEIETENNKKATIAAAIKAEKQKLNS